MRISMTNALGQATHTAYDSEGRVVATWGATYPVAYGYDDLGRMTALYTLRDASVAITNYSSFILHASSFDRTAWQYDLATGLLTNKVYADTNGTAYAYTPEGRLATRLWARGIETTYAYDACCGALTNIVYTNNAAPAVAFVHDRLGRQTAVTDGIGQWTFQYDPATLSLTNEILVSTAGATSLLARAADSLGRPAGYSLNLGGTTSASAASYGYDSLGRFGSVAWDTGGGSYTALYAYAANSDLVAGYDVPIGANTFRTRRAFEPQRDLIATVSNRWGNTPVSVYAYENDELARRTRRLDNGSVTNAFGYNGRSELATALMGTNTYGYVYDPIGNRLTATNNSETLTYLSNALNQYTNIADGVTLTPGYDLDGNLVSNGVWRYSWDGENRLVGASNGTVAATFGYDYMGRRAWKTVDGNTSRFQYDGWAMIAEVRDDGTTVSTNFYAYGLDLSGSLQGAGTIGGVLWAHFGGTTSVSSGFYAYDANGNVTGLVGTNGTNVATYAYDPFGNTTAQTGSLAEANPFRFSTKYTDDETGLLYYGQRYDSPSLGRWISRDPIGENGGLNLHTYCGNDGLDLLDVLGMDAWSPGGGYTEVGRAYQEIQDEARQRGFPEKMWNSVHAQIKRDPASSCEQFVGVTIALLKEGQNVTPILAGAFMPYDRNQLSNLLTIRLEPTGFGNGEMGAVFNHLHRLPTWEGVPNLGLGSRLSSNRHWTFVHFAGIGFARAQMLFGKSVVKNQFLEDIGQLRRARENGDQAVIAERCAEVIVDYIAHEFWKGIDSTTLPWWDGAHKRDPDKLDAFLSAFDLRGKLCGESACTCEEAERALADVVRGM